MQKNVKSNRPTIRYTAEEAAERATELNRRAETYPDLLLAEEDYGTTGVAGYALVLDLDSDSPEIIGFGWSEEDARIHACEHPRFSDADRLSLSHELFEALRESKDNIEFFKQDKSKIRNALVEMLFC